MGFETHVSKTDHQKKILNFKVNFEDFEKTVAFTGIHEHTRSIPNYRVARLKLPPFVLALCPCPWWKLSKTHRISCQNFNLNLEKISISWVDEKVFKKPVKVDIDFQRLLTLPVRRNNNFYRSLLVKVCISLGNSSFHND